MSKRIPMDARFRGHDVAGHRALPNGTSIAGTPHSEFHTQHSAYLPQLNCASNQSGTEPGNAANCCVRPVATSMA